MSRGLQNLRRVIPETLLDYLLLKMDLKALRNRSVRLKYRTRTRDHHVHNDTSLRLEGYMYDTLRTVLPLNDRS